MNQKLKEKIKEAFSSVLPISIIVLLFSVILVPMALGTIVMFIVGAIMLVVGMGLFSLGADMSLMPIGETTGEKLKKSNKIWIIVGICFLLGFITTIAEPDLQVLAEQVTSIPSMTLIITIAIGVGIFLVIAVLRILFKIKLSVLLFIMYGIIFVLSIFTPTNILAISFDSGGVTTGPMTVPFILALGLGFVGINADKDSKGDNFGFVALCSVGPILAVMILGIFFKPEDAEYSLAVIPELDTLRDVLQYFISELPDYLKEIGIALSPIFAFFVLFQIFTKSYKKRQVYKIIIGIIYTFVGLVLFLTGVNVGFIPVGSLLGSEIAINYEWLLIPLGMVIGYFIVAAEPAVHVLNQQVEEVSGGAISKRAMSLCLSLGVAVSVGLSMIRIVTGISIYWFLVPGYLIALALTFKVPKIFTGIAFDSGGVASGPMTSTFLLPLAIGASQGVGGNVLTDAFGIVAMVAMTPLIAIQVLGFVYKKKMDKLTQPENVTVKYTEAVETEQPLIESVIVASTESSNVKPTIETSQTQTIVDTVEVEKPSETQFCDDFLPIEMQEIIEMFKIPNTDDIDKSPKTPDDETEQEDNI